MSEIDKEMRDKLRASIEAQAAVMTDDEKIQRCADALKAFILTVYGEPRGFEIRLTPMGNDNVSPVLRTQQYQHYMNWLEENNVKTTKIPIEVIGVTKH